MIPALIDGRCDAIIASMSDTPERRLSIDFTDRYYRRRCASSGRRTPSSATRRTRSPARSWACSAARSTRPSCPRTIPPTLLKVYGNQEHVLLDLTLGRLDAVLGEAPQLDAGFLETPAGDGLRLLRRRPLRPGDPGHRRRDRRAQGGHRLRDRLSAAIAAIRADGTYDAIAARYFDFDIYGELTPVPYCP